MHNMAISNISILDVCDNDKYNIYHQGRIEKFIEQGGSEQEYLEKYSQALSTYFNENTINIHDIEKVEIDQINELISINSIFGLNLNIIPTSDINYSSVMEKINYYYSKFESSKSDDVIKNSESIQNTFEYLKEGEILPSEMDLIRFYNAYYNSKNKDHETIVDIIKDSLDLALRSSIV